MRVILRRVRTKWLDTTDFPLHHATPHRNFDSFRTTVWLAIFILRLGNFVTVLKKIWADDRVVYDRKYMNQFEVLLAQETEGKDITRQAINSIVANTIGGI